MQRTLKDLRIQAQKTQLQMAASLGYKAVSPYQRIENGKRKMIRPDMISRIAELLDSPIDDVMKAIQTGGDNNDPPTRQVRVRPPRQPGQAAGVHPLRR